MDYSLFFLSFPFLFPFLSFPFLSSLILVCSLTYTSYRKDVLPPFPLPPPLLPPPFFLANLNMFNPPPLFPLFRVLLLTQEVGEAPQKGISLRGQRNTERKEGEGNKDKGIRTKVVGGGLLDNKRSHRNIHSWVIFLDIQERLENVVFLLRFFFIIFFFFFACKFLFIFPFSNHHILP